MHHLGLTYWSWTFRRIADALEHYEGLGYRPADAPWAVAPESMDYTTPATAKRFKGPNGFLVGSAEQSFVEMWLRGDLTKGRHVAWSPCFRDEPRDPNKLRLPHFLKVELIDVCPGDPAAAVRKLRDDARDFLSGLAGPVDVVPTDEGEDLYLNGVEVGSYGYRERCGMRWAYGTGLAEPRFSQALEAA